jgi:hypothetical protein
MRRCLRDHPTLPEQLLEAIKRLNRDIVDAEQQLRKILPGASPDPASTERAASDASETDDEEAASLEATVAPPSADAAAS